jgi:ribosomal RNA-processing protein 12
MAKGKRWAKGQSSSSNPTSRKYRDISKSTRGFFSFGLPSSDKNSNSQLTRKALAELDSMSMTNDNNMDAKSLMSDNDSDGDTFKSWASNWSDCTNATFNKVHKYWQSNSSLHKEILAVLAAITEVIKENNGKESETEYFAALMTGLDSVKENEESTTAFLYLIALAIKKVPENVLRAKFEEVVVNLIEPLIKFGSDKANNTTLIKSSMKCLCWLLKNQDKQAWEKDVTMKTYLTILKFVEHPKPKVNIRMKHFFKEYAGKPRLLCPPSF